MPRTLLDRGLRDLHMCLLQLAQEVEGAFATTLTSLETGEYHPLQHILDQASSVKAHATLAEQHTLRLLILQQPLGGQDLRFLTAALYIGDHLGRMGDTVVQMTRTLLQVASLYHQTVSSALYSTEGNAIDSQGYLTDVFILRGLLLLGWDVQHHLHATISALAQRDVVLARTIQADQDFVELRYTPICQDIIKMQNQMTTPLLPQRDVTFVQRISHLLWIAHKLAEMATSITTLCQRIIFIVEG